MSERDYFYHRCLFYVGYEVLQHFPRDKEILETTLKEGALALFALQEMQRDDVDLIQKVYQLAQVKKN